VDVEDADNDMTRNAHQMDSSSIEKIILLVHSGFGLPGRSIQGFQLFA